MENWDGSQGSGRPTEVKPVVDLHTDSLIASRFFGYDLGKRHVPPLGFQPWRLHADFPRLAEGGVNGVWLGIVTSPFPRKSCLGRALRNLEYARMVRLRDGASTEAATITPRSRVAMASVSSALTRASP